MEQEKNKVLKVNVVTPDGNVYEHNAAIVIAKTVAGEIGILPDHAPIIAPLAIDEGSFCPKDSYTKVDLIGFKWVIMEVRDNVLTIIADTAERERDIDVSRAERAKQRAEARIQEAREKQDIDQLSRAEVALHRAMNRIKVSKHR